MISLRFFCALTRQVRPGGQGWLGAARGSKCVDPCGKIVLPVAFVVACTALSTVGVGSPHYVWWSVGSTGVQGLSCTWSSFRSSLVKIKIKRHKSVNLCRQVG